MIRIVCVTALVILACQGPAYAHPPSAIDATIAGTKADITVKHGVSNPANHYIKSIRLTAGGKTIADRTFTSQTDNNKQVTSFNLPPLKKGDAITVEADCNRSGILKKDFTVQ
jgi:desulfoferrodoxin (superoxide reductase-like protein)